MTARLLRHPGVSLLLVLAVCSPLLWAAARLSLGTGADSLLEGDPRSRFTYQLVEQSLSDSAVLVVVQSCPDVFTRESLGKLRDVSEAFSHLPGVRDVKSFTHSSIPVRRGFGLVMEPFLPAEWTDENLARSRAFSISHPLVRDLLVSPDAKHAVLLVTFASAAAHPSRNEIETLLGGFTDGRHSFQAISRPLVEAEVRERAERDLRLLVPAILAGVFLSLALYFKSFRLMVFLVGNLAAHSLLSAGLCALIPLDSGVYLLALFPLLAAIQLTLLIHLGSDFQDRFRDGARAGESVVTAVRSIFRSSFFAALTTVAGLLALLAAPGASNHAFGVLGGACVTLGFVLLFTLGPITLVLLHSGPGPGVGTGEAPWAVGWGRFLGWRRLPLALASLLLAGLACLPLLRPNLNLVDFMPADSSARSVAHFFDREFHGMYFLRLDLDSGKRGGVPEAGFLNYVRKVEQFAEKRPEVTAVYSHASVMAMINQVWSGWAPGSYKLPDNSLLLNVFQSALLGAQLPMTHALADPDWRVARLYVRTRILPSEDYLALHDAILAEARRLAPPGVSAQPAPGLRDFLEADRSVVSGQVASAVVSSIAIWLSLLALWRSFALSLAAVLCVAVPMASALGFAALLGVTLNSVTVMAGAIVLGVAVDDAVHFVTRWQELVRDGLAPPLAASETLREKRGPITLTSVVLLAVFIPLSFSSFPPVQGFAVVSALSFAGSLLSVLVFLPRVLAAKR